ncbi:MULTISPECIES: hypothetical protein [Streptomyces]|uniref:hypothetical protein n=1 Tax=Streptomyces TaxID=1883 RepID=UPI002249A0FA|nr:hypothetical protein [Streptomyces sp. JHD 1]MCX2967695.1 hypothetical protein [Streptomyces sp. JHD 1]
MGAWWYREVVVTGRLPLALALLAFVATFLVIRTVTRMIRAGRGPFRNVTGPGGTHIHHVVPGIVLMVVGGFCALGFSRHHAAAEVMAVVFGVGAGLVLDEFALVLYLDDVYWSEDGRKSVEAVVLTAALGSLLTLGFAPFGTEELTPEERENRFSLVSAVAGNVLLALVTLAKGKFRLAVVGVLVPFVALFGAVRLARPGSWWDRRVYRGRPRTRARARRRAHRYAAGWGRLGRRLDELLAGTPDDRPGPPRRPSR